MFQESILFTKKEEKPASVTRKVIALTNENFTEKESEKKTDKLQEMNVKSSKRCERINHSKV